MYMEYRETIRAETSDALAQITIAHYADNHHERFKELSKTTDTRGTQEVLKDRSIITYPRR
jgi:hypothetical protein